MHDSIFSNDGRYEITYRKDLTGFAQVVEYQGFAPRLEVSRMTIPLALLNMLMDKMLFDLATKVEFIEPVPQLTLSLS